MNEPALEPFFRLLKFDQVGSTNGEAKRLAAAGAPEGTLVWAREQSAGRGRRGRAWASPAGNLYLSLVLRPDCAPRAAAQLGFAAAVAVGETCARFLPQAAELRYKWPNDVLLDGRKLAGILLESQSAGEARLAWLVLGIGINLASHPEATQYPATSLAAAGAVVTPETMIAVLAERLLAWYERWRGAEGFAAVRRAWLLRAHGLGSEIRVRLAQSELAGRFAGLDGDGGLLLDGAEGRRRIAAGEIFPAG
ncbi:MAG TPA: biotin--[acetyl-CoA-carboxylase] ligase [Stellaceae bacterium]|nr:biotin--[acetyl-CoA-carboxylase] ligase [Stellaceae bacterium]